MRARRIAARCRVNSAPTTLGAAVGLGALVGPSQAGARTVEMAIARYHHPIWTKLASVTFVTIGVATLWTGLPVLPAALIRRRHRLAWPGIFTCSDMVFWTMLERDATSPAGTPSTPARSRNVFSTRTLGISVAGACTREYSASQAFRLVLEDERRCNQVIAADAATAANHDGCDFLKGLHVGLCYARIAHSRPERTQAGIEGWRCLDVIDHLRSSWSAT
ncbi:MULTISPECIES: hypothetical protein [unclassified Mesorhizobium]|uniref:hypothetical protein n=1 Tax=unclassified Mesorhizobium TaxID=325217 RepID=UPI0032AF2442